MARTGPAAICPTCRRKVAVRVDGTLRRHGYLPGTGQLEDCPGSGPGDGDRKARCGTCGRLTRARLDGTLRPHHRAGVSGEERCPGNGPQVVPLTHHNETTP